MKTILRFQLQAIVGWVLLVSAQGADAQAAWRLDTRGAAGPIAQVALASSGGKQRTSFIVFEYARNCDPIFSFAEFTGSRLGPAVSQSVLNGTKIGVVVNGQFHTWHAAMTTYGNGYEVGFGIPNELFNLLRGQVYSLVYVTPDGERIPMPVGGFGYAVQSALDTCAERFR